MSNLLKLLIEHLHNSILQTCHLHLVSCVEGDAPGLFYSGDFLLEDVTHVVESVAVHGLAGDVVHILRGNIKEFVVH